MGTWVAPGRPGNPTKCKAVERPPAVSGTYRGPLSEPQEGKAACPECTPKMETEHTNQVVEADVALGWLITLVGVGTSVCPSASLPPCYAA